MTNEIKIRDFSNDDINSITDLTVALGYNTNIEQMTLRMNNILQFDNYWTFVAEFENQIIGYIGLTKNYFWEQDGHFIRIQAFVVNKEYRRNGVGKKLLEYTECFAKRIGSKLISLNCGNREERQSAHKFYPKMGFEAKSTGYIKKII